MKWLKKLQSFVVLSYSNKLMLPFSGNGEDRLQIVNKSNVITPEPRPRDAYRISPTESDMFSTYTSNIDSTGIDSSYAKLVRVLNEDEETFSPLQLQFETVKNRKCNCKPKCCNLACCGYICLFILLLIGSTIGIIIGAIHSIKHPEFKGIYVELFEYNRFTEKLVPIIYVNGTGRLIAEMKNNMKKSGRLHDIALDITAVNIVGNKVLYI